MSFTKRKSCGLKEIEKIMEFVTTTTGNREAVAKSDILIFAVQPGNL